MVRIIVLEIGRPILADVKLQLGEVFKVISYPRQISEAEYPQIIREIYHAVREASAGGEEVGLVLSGPLALVFMLGQVIGLNHFKIRLFQFSGGRYIEVPPIKREDLF